MVLFQGLLYLAQSGRIPSGHPIDQFTPQRRQTVKADFDFRRDHVNAFEKRVGFPSAVFPVVGEAFGLANGLLGLCHGIMVHVPEEFPFCRAHAFVEVAGRTRPVSIDRIGSAQGVFRRLPDGPVDRGRAGVAVGRIGPAVPGHRLVFSKRFAEQLQSLLIKQGHALVSGLVHTRDLFCQRRFRFGFSWHGRRNGRHRRSFRRRYRRYRFLPFVNGPVDPLAKGRVVLVIA